jgi:archaeosortase B (VPXXXP-CTERM-specific)
MANRPQLLRFAVVMAFYTGIILWLDRDEVLGEWLAPLTLLTARATLVLLHGVGMEAVREGNVIVHPQGFAYQIYYSCTAFIPILSLSVAILAYPGRLRVKWPGIAVGVPVLLALNLIRLVHLFHVGVHQPVRFEYVHHTLWENFLILMIIVLWFSWVRWSEKAAISKAEGERESSPRLPAVSRRRVWMFQKIK